MASANNVGAHLSGVHGPHRGLTDSGVIGAMFQDRQDIHHNGLELWIVCDRSELTAMNVSLGEKENGNEVLVEYEITTDRWKGTQ